MRIEAGACWTETAPPPRYVLRPYIAALGYRALDNAKARRQHRKVVRQGRLASRNLKPRVKAGALLGMVKRVALPHGQE